MTALLRGAVVVFVVSSVAVGCGSRQAAETADSATGAASGAGLECGGEREQLIEGDLDPTSPGSATEAEAANDALAFYIDQNGGEVGMLHSGAYALEVGGRNVVVAEVTPSPAGGYWVTTVRLCESFVPVETGPPETLPLATATP